MDLGFDLRYYLSLLRRRFLYIFLPFIFVLGASTAVAVLLPPVYRSTGKILVESQQIPDELIRSTVTSFAGERIEIIKQRVMTRENILRIVEKFNLYEGKRQQTSASEIVDSVHQAIAVEPLNADILGASRQGKATIAFTVSFEHTRPDTAVRVANELMTLFLEENVRTRTARAAETTDFLKQESAKLKKQVDRIEEQIAKYKEQYGNALPEHLDSRMAMLERVKANLTETNREIKAIEAEKRFLDIQLVAARSGVSAAGGPGQLSGRRLTPQQELAFLQMDLLEKSAIYDAAHPDVGALKRKIAALSRQHEAETERRTLERRLRDLELQLKDARTRYSEKHPDIKRLTSEVATARGQLANLPPASAGRGPGGESAADPIYANVQAQIEVANGRRASLDTQRQMLEKRITELETSIVQTPEVERSLKALSRDHQNAVRKYDEIKSKEMEAQLAKNLEEDKKAERFSVLEPPIFPDEPVKPNRRKMIAFGFALALAAGGGGLLVIESIDGSIRGTAGYRAMLKQSPLVAIPYIATAGELRRRRQLLIAFLAILIAAVILALVVLHFTYKPLDALFFKLVERFQ